MSLGMILCACRGDAVDHNALITALALSRAHVAALRIIQTTAPQPFLPEALGVRGSLVSRCEGRMLSVDLPALERQRTEEAISVAIALARRAGFTVQVGGRDRVHGDRYHIQLRVCPGTLDAFLPSESRCCDLVVMGYDNGPGEQASTALAVMRSHRPVLLVPRQLGLSYLTAGRPDCVTIAWDESVECMHAIRGVMSLLVTARRVRIVTVADSPNAPESCITRDFRTYAKGRGLDSEICRVMRDDRAPADAFLAVCPQNPEDLLVMGTRGHRSAPSQNGSHTDMTDYVLTHARVPLLLSQ